MGKSPQRERNAWSSVLITAGALVAAWASIELAFKPLLAAGRASIDRELDPDYDPDDELQQGPARPQSPNEEARAEAFEALKSQSGSSKDL